MEILYADQALAVCLKPPGLDSESQVPQTLAEALGGPFFPVHRLDRNVGGLMVYARTPAAAGELSRAIQAGSFQKEYVALVHGTPPDQEDWRDLLWMDSRKNKVYVVRRMRAGVREARLTYRTLRPGPLSLVRVRLYTGRSHQIRVQFASRGYPLAGDRKYGARDGYSAPMLFSCGLTFPHQGRILTFQRLPDWAEFPEIM